MTTVRMSAISEVASARRMVNNFSSGVLTARAKVMSRSGPQVSRNISSTRPKVCGRLAERGL